MSTWSLPPEPGPEVTAVRCMCCATVWRRVHRPEFVDLWVPSSGGELHGRQWQPLVGDHSAPEFPLTDATEEVSS